LIDLRRRICGFIKEARARVLRGKKCQRGSERETGEQAIVRHGFRAGLAVGDEMMDREKEKRDQQRSEIWAPSRFQSKSRLPLQPMAPGLGAGRWAGLGARVEETPARPEATPWMRPGMPGPAACLVRKSTRSSHVTCHSREEHQAAVPARPIRRRAAAQPTAATQGWLALLVMLRMPKRTLAAGGA